MSLIRRRFSKSEKLEIVKLSMESDSSFESIALQYKIHPNSIYRWRKQFLLHADQAFPGNGNKVLSEEQKEIERLRRVNSELELEKEILKKALGIFSSPNKKNLLL
jgi:transposase